MVMDTEDTCTLHLKNHSLTSDYSILAYPVPETPRVRMAMDGHNHTHVHL
jgi:hypothetical protein